MELAPQVKTSITNPTFILNSRGPFYWHELILDPTWICNYRHYKVQDEITYSFLTFKSATVEPLKFGNV